ncbi:MAG: citryl-CoA lyase [Kofleriaceae bacterium]
MTTTKIATSSKTAITIRGKDLVDELIGTLTFTEMLYFQILGVVPTSGQAAVVDACLVALMEHGLTPSAIATRLVYGSAPEAMQGAVAAGLLGVGSRFVGTTEGCAALLERIVAVPVETRRATCAAIIAEHAAAKQPLPGFGHDLHVPDDPRTPKLFAVARSHGLAGDRIAALELLGAVLDETKRRHITINATGAVAALLGDAGVPAPILRGFAIIARCAGLVGHIHEEQRDPALLAMWQAAERAVPYEPEETKP